MGNDNRSFLLDEILQELPTLALGTGALFLSSFANQSFPSLIGRIVDNDDRRGGSGGWKVALVVLGGGVASFLRTYTLQIAEERVASRLSQQAFSSVLTRKSLGWFQQPAETDSGGGDDGEDDDENPGEFLTTPAAISSVISDDIQKISRTLTVTLANLVRSSSSVIFSTANMLLLNSSLFAVTALVVPLVGAAAMVLRKRIKKLEQERGDRKARLVSFVQERLIHIRMVRQCGRSADEVDNYRTQRGELTDMAERNSLQEGVLMGFLFSGASAAVLLVVTMGGKATTQRQMTGGELTSFSTYAFLMGLGTSGILRASGEATLGLVAADRYFHLINDRSNDDTTECANDDPAVQPRDVQEVEINNVSFVYGKKEEPVVRNLTMKLPKGRVVALVGRNGSGKSTIASILCGLYQPQTGSVIVHGTDWSAELRQISQSKRQQLIQMVPQTSALLDLSILENIRYGNPKASLLDVRYALTKANCNEFVSRLAGGIEFVVGRNGEKLSGGERQRLALARALLADPSVLILDEPGTSMDRHGLSAVADVVSSGRSMLLITHNAKTLELADHVVVLKDGSIVEEGTFASLRSNPQSHLCALMPSVRC